MIIPAGIPDPLVMLGHEYSWAKIGIVNMESIVSFFCIVLAAHMALLFRYRFQWCPFVLFLLPPRRSMLGKHQMYFELLNLVEDAGQKHLKARLCSM